MAPADLPALSAADGSARMVELTGQRFNRGRLSVDYRADAPFILNAAVTYDPRWSAFVNGEAASVVRANYGGLAVLVPKGAGQVQFVYRDVAGQWLLVSRVLLNLVALAGIVLLSAPLFVGSRVRSFMRGLPGAGIGAIAWLRGKVRSLRRSAVAPSSDAGPVPPSPNPEPPPPLSGRQRRLLLGLVLVLFGVTIFQGVRAGADQTLPGPMTRHRDAAAAAITYVKHGQWLGYANFRAVVQAMNDAGLAILPEQARRAGVENYFEALRRPEVVDGAFASAASLTSPAEHGLFYSAQDDRGLAFYYVAAFALFGISVASLFKLYILLFGISVAAFLLTFHREPRALILLILWLCVHAAIVRIIGDLPHDVHVVHGNRFLSLLSMLAMFHFMLLIVCRVPPRPINLIAAGLQLALLLLVINARTSTFWQFISVALLFGGLTAGWLWHRRRSTTVVPRPPAWPLALIFVGFIALSLHQRVVTTEHYRGDTSQVGHGLWHPLVNALHNNPNRTKRFGIPAGLPIWDDAVVYWVFESEIAQRGQSLEDYIIGDADWPLRTSERRWDYNWGRYEGVLKQYFWRTVAEHPAYALRSFLVEQPVAALRFLTAREFWRWDVLLSPWLLLPYLAGIALLWRHMRSSAGDLFSVIAAAAAGALIPLSMITVTSIRMAEIMAAVFLASGVAVGILIVAYASKAVRQIYRRFHEIPAKH